MFERAYFIKARVHDPAVGWKVVQPHQEEVLSVWTHCKEIN